VDAKTATQILSPITYPRYMAIRFEVDEQDTVVGMNIALSVKDRETGKRTGVGVDIPIDSDISPEALVSEVMMMVASLEAHEAFENFRYNGEVAFDPHDRGFSENLDSKFIQIFTGRVPSDFMLPLPSEGKKRRGFKKIFLEKKKKSDE